MTELTFQHIKRFSLSPCLVGTPWLVAVEQLSGITHLKFIAKGQWTPLPGLDNCGPDGISTTAIATISLIIVDCTVGALIGRIGGSSATVTATGEATAENKPFAIGSLAIFKPAEKAIGPLFLGFNIAYRPLSLQSLEVDILGAPAP